MSTIKNAQRENLKLSFKEIYLFDKRLVFILFTDIFISAVMPFPNVILSGRIVDSITEKNEFFVVVFYVLLLFGINFVLSTASIILSKARDYLFLKLLNKFDNEINEKCINIDYEKFNDSAIQDRILLINEAVRGNNFFTSLTTVFATISKIITLIGIIAIMTKLNIWLFAIAIVVIVLQSFLHYFRLKFERKYKADSVHEQRNINYVSNLAKSVEAKKDIVTFDMGGFILDKIKKYQDTLLIYEKRRVYIAGIIEICIYALTVAFQIAAYVLIGVNAFRGVISIGDFTMGIASMINFMAASSFVATNVVNFNDGYFYIKQYNSFLKYKSKFTEKPEFSIDDIDLSKITIEFKKVSFRYPNSTSYVLKDINIKINNNEKLGIVGFNGAGKTTFVLLLTRMYEPTEGEILLNGINIKRIKYSDYQKIFSTVYQDYNLMAFSLINNIAISDNVSDEQKACIEELIRKNGMEERMAKLYRGLDTPITKMLSASGVDLSGGERQKIAIIRALYKNSPFLILDEPTSALDPVAETEVYQKFASMSENKTTVFISHRIYSTRFCDKIAVFNQGKIVEYGTFEELLEMGGLYHEFFQTQADNYKESI